MKDIRWAKKFVVELSNRLGDESDYEEKLLPKFTKLMEILNQQLPKQKMTAEELYERLDGAGVSFEIVENFEGLRLLQFMVEEEHEEEV